MATYRAPIEDMKFLLYNVFNAQQEWETNAFKTDVSADLVDAILEELNRITHETFLPINREGDEVGCTIKDGVVTTPPGFKEAYQQYVEGGWVGLSGDPDFEGQGMPKMLNVLCEEMLHATNTSLSLYPLLSSGASLSILNHASEAQKCLLLPKLYNGEWAGTMCLTEPHAGTDLGIIKTKADPVGDAYEISGTKIFITGGEHDMSENIVHLVLARLPDAPAGTKGISLFIVPKFMYDDTGALGERNSVTCDAIEHKMGIKGSATCVMNFEKAKGYLLGEPNKGLNYMFTMMNYERLSIGIQGLGLAASAYQSSVEYAKDRVQGKGRSAEAAPHPIIVHPDVRRMLLTQKSLVEGGRALAVWVGQYLDRAKYHPDENARAQAQVMVEFLTPIAKAFFTDRGLDCCILGQQVFGGHGYIREWGMEQLVRDARIAQIYEGTNGIQALDLIGRKVAMTKGESFKVYVKEVQALLENIDVDEAWQEQVTSLIAELEGLTMQVLTAAQTNPDEIGAASCDYLDAVGYLTYAVLWLKMVDCAKEGLSEDAAEAKRKTAAFFFSRVLSQAHAHIAKAKAGAAAVMDMEASHF